VGVKVAEGSRVGSGVSVSLGIGVSVRVDVSEGVEVRLDVKDGWAVSAGDRTVEEGAKAAREADWQAVNKITKQGKSKIRRIIIFLRKSITKPCKQDNTKIRSKSHAAGPSKKRV
jgi:hypothetical protein